MPMRVEDVMTPEVVAVRGPTPFRDLVRLLCEHHVSALPVVDDAGRAIGVVSESDLYLKQVPALRNGAWHLLQSRRRTSERAKASGATAGKLMGAPAITINRRQPIGEAAQRLHDRGVKHLAVVDDAGVLVGIVARSDLLKAHLRPDEEIRRELAERVVPEVLERVAESVQVQRFATLADIDAAAPTIEEREEYEEPARQAW